MKHTILFLISLLTAFSLSAENLVPSLGENSKWIPSGKVTLTPGTHNGQPIIKADVSASEGGFSCRNIPLQQGSYRLKFSYRTIRARLRVIVKHGNNTYSALDKGFPATNGQWQDAEVTFTEDKPGAHSSVWFLTSGAIEIANPSLEFIPPAAPEAAAADDGYGENLLPAYDNSRWVSLKGASVCRENGKVVKFTANGSEGSFSCREIPITNGTYRLRLYYRNVRGTLRIAIKHGNNTYGVYHQAMPASDQWREVVIDFTEELGGSHGSVWFITSGEVELTGISLTRKLSAAEAAISILNPVPATAPAPLPALPDLSKKIVLMQEYHMWFSSPFAASGGSPGISVWG